MEKNEEYYKNLDKRTNEYKGWKKAQTDLQPHEPKPSEQLQNIKDVIDIAVNNGYIKTEAQGILSQPKPSEGLGDTLEKVFKATKIDKLVKFVMGEDCGCDERKKKLNERFAYSKKPECLTEEEYNRLDNFFGKNPQSIKPSEQKEARVIHKRIFKYEEGTCDGCVRSMMNNLKTVYEAYK